MIVKIYALKDIKVAFKSPVVMHNDEEMKRACSFIVNSGDKQNEICLCPQDYELWCLGDYDDVTGHIIPEPRFICNLLELKQNNGGVENAGENL